jgi:predicted lipoprotein with Yx(FWY)xxD motif
VFNGAFEEDLMRRVAGVVGAIVLGLGVLTACGDDKGADSNSSSSSGATAQLKTADSGLGKILVDGNGRAVYVFDKDTAGKSNCEGDCLAKWPAVAAGDSTPKLEGVEVSTITRSDGSKQLAVGGLPIYLFAGDSKAGETKGQAVGGVWWVVGPDGKKITTQPSADGNSGY